MVHEVAKLAVPEAARSPRWRRWLFEGGRLLFGLVVLVIVVRQVDFDDLRTLTTAAHLVWAAGAFAFLSANVWVAAWRWQLLLHILGVSERIGPLLRAIYVGAFYNLVLPGQLGGQAIKVVLVGRRSPALAAIIASVAMDQLVVVAALLAVAAAAAALAPGLAHQADWVLGLSASALVATGIVAAAASARLQTRVRRRVRSLPLLHRLPAGIRSRAGDTWTALSGYGRRPLLMVAAVAQGTLFFLTLAGMAVAVGRALGIELSPATMTFVLTLGLIAGVAPFTLAGLGTREPAFVAALGSFGVHRPSAPAFAVLWLLLNSLADMLGAVLQFWHPRQTGTLEAPVSRP